ncbi:GDP-mannose 4,6-dehydratase [bacterium]|nr:GDP-mannose 4,6-dehydratase [bacterium]
MKVLVTGCCGFIGYHVCKRIMERGHDVVGIDNMNDYYDPQLKEDRLKGLVNFHKELIGDRSDNFFFLRGDVKDYGLLDSLVKEQEPWLILHLAAQAGVRYSLENPFVYHDSNLTGFMNILEISRQHELSLVYASSSSVYGDSKKKKFKETQNTDFPVSLYAATKKANEVMAYSYSKLYDQPMIGLRFFTVYGPWGRPDMAIYKFTKNILEGKPIDVYNEGNMYRDFTYIDDIVEGIYTSLRVLSEYEWEEGTIPHEIYNLGCGNPRKLIDFVRTIEKYCGKKADINFLPLQPGDVLKTSASITKAKNKLDFWPGTEMEEGIKNFVEWYKSYFL